MTGGLEKSSERWRQAMKMGQLQRLWVKWVKGRDLHSRGEWELEEVGTMGRGNPENREA